jgi:hypothetical protein
LIETEIARSVDLPLHDIAIDASGLGNIVAHRKAAAKAAQ